MRDDKHEPRPDRPDHDEAGDAWRRICPHCTGTGLIDDSPCPNCDGSGRISEPGEEQRDPG